MNTAVHDYSVEPEGNGYRAQCLCGWQGHKRVFFGDARREAQDHYQAEVTQ